MSKGFKEFVVYFYKATIAVCLVSIFFLVFSTKNGALLTLSRTLAITISTYTFGVIIMSKIYGFMQIGSYKSKQIIFNSTMTLLVANVVTYAQLMIMNTNPMNPQSNPRFTLSNLHLLLLVVVIQYIVVYVSTYFGNWLYFEMFSASKTIVIYGKNYNVNKIQNTLERYKLQYRNIEMINEDHTDLMNYLDESNYIVLSGLEAQRKSELILLCYEKNVNFTIERSIQDVIVSSGVFDVVDDIPIINIYSEKLSIFQMFSKRLFDLVVSTFMLLLTMPVIIICALLIKLDDGGKVFFLQKRATKEHKEFFVIKFRTMHENVENFSSTGKNDDRITKIGSILRKTRLDELPQLFNIFIGDMSLVGPRPEMLENVEQYEKDLPMFKYRLKVKAGLTGLAQIEGKYNTTPMDKLILDLTYIENYSFWFDLKLLFKTILVFNKSDSTEGFKE